MEHGSPAKFQIAQAARIARPVSMLEALDEFERKLILDALVSSHGNIAQAARNLSVTERIMGRRVKKYGIDAKQFRAAR